MRLRFGHPKIQLTKKYDRRKDLCDHLAKWTKFYGMEPQPQWVHLFYHNLDTIPMNWYLETKLRQGTVEWDILREAFLMPFSFENGFKCIDEALHDIKSIIFKIPQDPLELVQPNWSTQLCHLLECYNVMAEGEDEDPRNIKIPEEKIHCEVEGLQIENVYITMPLKTTQVNIGTEVEPKFANIGDYCDDAIVYKVVALLRKCQYFFPTKFSDLKGIIGDLGVMKITLKSNVEALRKGRIALIPNTRKMSTWSWIRC